jgi:hypothetical protein
VLGSEKEFGLERSLVSCMQRLAQSIGGLRSAATTQFALLRESADAEGSVAPSKGYPFVKASSGSMKATRHDRFATLTAIEEASEESSDDLPSPYRPAYHRTNSSASMENSTLPPIKNPADIFSRFIDQLGPSMKSLAYTLVEILEELPFGAGPSYSITFNAQFRHSLTDALSV